MQTLLSLSEDWPWGADTTSCSDPIQVRSCARFKILYQDLYHVDEYLKGFCFGSDQLTSAREALASSVESTVLVPGESLIWGTRNPGFAQVCMFTENKSCVFYCLMLQAALLWSKDHPRAHMREGKMCQLLRQRRQTAIRTQLLLCQVQWLLHCPRRKWFASSTSLKWGSWVRATTWEFLFLQVLSPARALKPPSGWVGIKFLTHLTTALQAGSTKWLGEILGLAQLAKQSWE